MALPEPADLIARSREIPKAGKHQQGTEPPAFERRGGGHRPASAASFFSDLANIQLRQACSPRWFSSSAPLQMTTINGPRIEPPCAQSTRVHRARTPARGPVGSLRARAKWCYAVRLRAISAREYVWRAPAKRTPLDRALVRVRLRQSRQILICAPRGRIRRAQEHISKNRNGKRIQSPRAQISAKQRSM